MNKTVIVPITRPLYYELRFVKGRCGSASFISKANRPEMIWASCVTDLQ